TLKLSDLPQGRIPAPAPTTTGDSTCDPDSTPTSSAAEGGVTTVKIGPTSRRLRTMRAKKKAAEEREQGLVAPNYPTVILQAYHNMQRLENCVVLTRVGGFYELYLHQADELGPLLNLKVSQRKTSEGLVSMAGFPFFQLERYLKLLVQDLSRHVAIVEEFPKSDIERARTGILHDRKVARIVTPGTLIDEDFIDPFSNNYAMAIHIGTAPPKVATAEADPTVGPESTVETESQLDSITETHSKPESDSAVKKDTVAIAHSPNGTIVSSADAGTNAHANATSTSDELEPAALASLPVAEPDIVPSFDHKITPASDSSITPSPSPSTHPSPVSLPCPSHVSKPTTTLPAVTSTPLGLAWLDLSTGHFFTQSTDLASLSSILSRVSPREIVLDRALAPAGSAFAFLSDAAVGAVDSVSNATLSSAKSQPTASSPSTIVPPVTKLPSAAAVDAVHAVIAEDRTLVSYADSGHFLNLSSWDSMLETPIPEVTARAFTAQEISAGSLLLRYVGDRLQGSSIKVQTPQRRESLNAMTIDRNTLKSLEIKLTIRDGSFKGSLLHTVRRTVTRSGARLLAEWLTSPSIDLAIIKERQDLVSVFLKDKDLRDTITMLLKRTHDSQRLAQKFALGRGKPDDLLGLAATITNTSEISRHLASGAAKIPADEAACVFALLSRTDLTGPLKLAKSIYAAIDQEGLSHQNELEETAANQMIALAHDVVNAEGTPTDVADLPRAITEAASNPAVKEAKKKARSTASLRDAYGEDSEIWVMKPSASRVLKSLHTDLANLKSQKDALEVSLRTRYAAPSLTLKWGLGLGHICHIKGKDAFAAAALNPTSSAGAEDLRSKNILRASRTTRTFHVPEWTDLGTQIDQARLAIRTEEKRILNSLCTKVVANLVKLRRNAEVLDEIDITTSFAALAEEHGLVRPEINASVAMAVHGGRHPTVEAGLRENGRTFSRNDCILGGPANGRVWLVTGPNMAGKSTFLRQNALLIILAQVGCFVPAESAQLGLVDALFSRVGSADNLYRDQSTFMVEMMETAQILRSATEHSFVIMDEIGRGTTPADGVAVAYASLKHLVEVNQCRTLFATHFHGVADLARADGLMAAGGDGEEGVGAVEAYCTDVHEDEDGSFMYIHKLRKGVNRCSHALKVAELAGLPLLAIETAKTILERNPNLE
ncbi:hypothetical protein TD95_004781, partial [Thielaviopsis punctulata]